MKFYEIASIDGSTLMIDICKIVSIREFPQWMEVAMMDGRVLSVIPQTLMSAFEAEKVGYFKFQKEEAEEPAREVEGEVIPA